MVALQALELLHQRAGRKRKSTRRMAGDRSPRETIEQVRSIVIAQRTKLGATPRNIRSQDWATTIGRLRLEGSIDETQLWTAGRYAACVFSYWSIWGIAPPKPRSGSL